MTHPWQWQYPPLACHSHGWLEVGDGHAIHWEECGNPLGLPALFLHGGPGAGCTAQDRRWFDPSRYRIVLFDQRGCGRSRPLGRLEANTADALLADIETLRRHLRIDRWLLFGGSWGATLALAYAERLPERVHALVLRGVYAATAGERRWLYAPGGVAQLQPQDWQCFVDPIPPHARGNLLAAYQQQLDSDDPRIRATATRAWLAWELSLMAHESPGCPAAISPDPPDAAAHAMARIGVHYARHAGLLARGSLWSNAGRLAGVPGVIEQGGLDRVTPPATALALHRAWPGSRLQWVARGGHASSHPEIARALVEATDAFALPGGAAPVSNHDHKETTHGRGDTMR